MLLAGLIERLWGQRARFLILLLASFLLLFLFLGARDLWTQEHRWADIVAGMFYRHDFLHPYLNENFYYDKPLLSYWLIVAFAKLSGALTTWALRLPTAIFGLVTILSVYWLGKNFKDKQLGMLAGWMLLTTYYFIFWSRVSITDILNLGGTTLAIAWYIAKCERTSFLDYTIFFMIIGMTSLFKGLVGAIIPCLAVFLHILLNHTWKKHLHVQTLLSIIPGLIIYFLPFWASSHYSIPGYGENGLYLVYQENFLRYFQPFDHIDPFYTYFIAVPILLLPWTLFFIPALLSAPIRWKKMSINSRWMVLTLSCIFLFFTLSGSRRSYYIFPAVPFAILLTADWILSGGYKKQLYSAILVVISFVAILFAVDIFPAWYSEYYGIKPFAQRVLNVRPRMALTDQNVTLLDADSKLYFYLNLPPTVKLYRVTGERAEQTTASLLKTWPMLHQTDPRMIYITRKCYASLLAPYFTDYHMISMPSPKKWLFMPKNDDLNSLVAFIPNTSIL